MPKLLPLEKKVEQRIRDLLDKGYAGLDADHKLEVIKMGIGWVKATKKGGDGQYGEFFKDDPDEEET